MIQTTAAAQLALAPATPATSAPISGAPLMSGVLQQTNEPFSLRWITTGHIPALMTLQSVAAGQETIHRTAEFFEDFLAAGHRAMGIFNSTDTMVGSAIIRTMIAPIETLCAPLAEFLNDDGTPKPQSMLGTVMTHPDYRGNGLMGHMIDQWIDLHRMNGTIHLHARVRMENERSWKNFVRKDFKIIATGPSPEDATRTVHFLHRMA